VPELSPLVPRLVWMACSLIAIAIGGTVYSQSRINLVSDWRMALGNKSEKPQNGAFSLRSEWPMEAEEAERLLLEMARLQSDLTEMFPLPLNGRPIEGNLFATKESYLAYVTKRFPEVADRPALYVHDAGVGRILLYAHSNTLDDLRHECTHAILHKMFPSIPLWLDEGLAEYFEVPRDRRVDENPYLVELKELIQAGWQPNLLRLEQKLQLTEFTGEDYRESWAWTHFLLHGPQPVRQVFTEFLIESQSGGGISRLSEKLNSCFTQLETDLISHLKDW